MIWGFACCCAPAPGEQSQKVQSQPASAKPVEAASPCHKGKAAELQPEHADGRRPQEDGPGPAKTAARRSGGGTDTSPLSATSKQPPREEPTAQADPDVETVSARSSRSAKSARSAGASSNVSSASIASEFIQERIPARQREASRIQQAMKTFVRSMVRGQRMGVITPDGQLCTCTCSLDKRLKFFIIELKGSERRIALRDITEVFQGKEPEDIDTPLDELCSTLMLETGDCISFHFPDESSREHFAMCLQILVDGQQ
mmetsp:Transcript_111839/g.311251  ORF Transcript_111839/g.311251 Transcript_111839/m.311251 type:complete len:258 (+) Transcript_111839:123-896(+)